MAVSTSYRLDSELKRRLSERSEVEGVTETALVSRLLDEGLKTADHPGIIYRNGPTGRRAALAAGPDVWEVVSALRSASGEGEARIADVAEQVGLPTHVVRIAIEFAAEHRDEIERRIAMNDEAAERVRKLTEEPANPLAS